MGPVQPEDRTGGGDGLQRNVSPQSTISSLSAMKHYVLSASVLSASPQEDEPSFAQSNCQTQIGRGAARSTWADGGPSPRRSGLSFLKLCFEICAFL